MKRSKSISLLLMGSLTLSSAGCSSEPEVSESYSAFTSVQECISSGLFTGDECRDFARSALEQSPLFASKEECEQKFGVGACDMAQAALGQATAGQTASTQTNSTAVQPQSHSSWMPMMMGFMAGRFLGGGGYMQGAQPLYNEKKEDNSGTRTAARGATTAARSFRTASGESVTADSKGKISNPSSSMKQGLTRQAKPMMSRSGKAASGGFSGSRGSSGS